jgi:uncharacterized SAM-binding protein YcdF (DUF218 family)
MRNIVIVVVAVLGLSILLLSVYLTPDDMRGCQASPTTKTNCLRADAILAISGGNTSIRTAEAITLYQNGWAKKLIFAGAAQDTSGPSNAEVMRQQAIHAGVPAGDIAIDSLSRTTKQNAEKSKRLLIETSGPEARRVILVTSPYHQRRAGLEFRQHFGPSITIINHPAPHDPDWPPLWWLTPRGWWLAIGELVKIIAFYTGQSQ